MTEPSPDSPQTENTPVENRQVEQQAMNPAVTNEKGERVDGGEGQALGAGPDSADPEPDASDVDAKGGV